jgi:hypothetical protein
LWVIPQEHTKGGITVKIHLTHLMKSILQELKTFAEENNISLRDAIDIQLIDSLRGISHRIYESYETSKGKNRII